jgi:flagellar hook-associated protein FlgK
MPDAILVGLSALQAHQRAIEVTSHNIANATSPGYTRQRADLAANAPENISIGQIGRGVTTEGIRRLANDIVIERLRQGESEASRLSRLQETLDAAEKLFNEPGDNGISASINKLFSTFEDLSNNPESSALRSAVVGQLDSFAYTMNNLGSSLENLRTSMQGSLESTVVEVNRLTSEINKLNQGVREQTIAGNSPNDLMDRRDKLIGELSQHLELRVRHMPNDGSVMIDAAGSLLVGLNYSEQISVGTQTDGSLVLLASNKSAIAAGGGEVGALLDLHNTYLPDLISQMDDVANILAGELNARQSTGTNHAFPATSFTSGQAIDTTLSAVNLDDESQIQSTMGGLGIPSVYMPSFTDENGNIVPRNLTINVYDPVAKTAQKYMVRYDPSTSDGERSLDDLISVINTGRSTLSGGFTLYPPDAAGIANLTASKVPVDGGYRLELSASNGKQLDFSTALDVNPATGAWTSGATTISGIDAALAGKRVTFTVVGNTLQASTRDPNTGVAQAYGTPFVLGGAVGAIGALSLALTAGASNYLSGDSFSVDFDSTGAVVNGTQLPEWTAGDAATKITGRYTGTLAFIPGQEWSIRVVSAGTIGSSTNAPIVEFSYFTGSKDAPVQQTMQRILDDSYIAGAPVQIADGVYATFAAGSFSTPGNQVSFVVDSEPDQARLLPALGINTMFDGTTAATLKLNNNLRKNPNLLGIASSRSEGDNANLLGMAAVRQGESFGDGQMAIDDFYHATITDLGVRFADTKRLADNQGLMQKTLENQRQETSGVSIDEEVATLILMQQAYTAAARIISTARENITTLMDVMR